MAIRILSRRAWQAAGFAALLLAGAALADQPLQISAGIDTHSPAVAYDSDRDRYLVVYQNAFGRLEGQLRAGDGTVVRGYLGLLPHYLGVEYREPRVTYKPHTRIWIMTAIMEDRSRPLPRTVLTVSGLHADGHLLWTYDVPGVDNTVRTPDVVADTFADRCCILITWKEGYGTIYGRQIDADGGFVGGRIDIFRDGGRFSEHAFNPRLAYQALRDEFVVVYQRTVRGAKPRLELRAVRPVSGTLGFLRAPVSLHENPRTSYGEKFSGGPDIAWDPVAQRYLLAWRDDRYLRAVLLDREGWMASNPVNLFVDDEARGDRLAGGIPEVIAATGRDRFLVSHARELDGVFGADSPAHWLEGWWVDLLGRPLRRPVSTWWFPEAAGRSAVGFSPVSGRAFVVWERDEPVWGVVEQPPRDLYWEGPAPP
jgi:hypothetical protein